VDGDAAVVRGEKPPSARVPSSDERIRDTAPEFIEGDERSVAGGGVIDRAALAGDDCPSGSVVHGRLVPSGAVSSDAHHEAGRLHREAQLARLGEHVTVHLAQLWWVDSHCEVTAPVTLERRSVAPVGQHP
jgi:hypothetical protein